MRLALILALAAAASGAGAQAGEAPHRLTLTLKDHRFTPAEVTVPAGKLRVVDESAGALR